MIYLAYEDREFKSNHKPAHNPSVYQKNWHDFIFGQDDLKKFVK